MPPTLVLACSVSLISVQAQKFAHSTARPLPKKQAFWGTPVDTSGKVWVSPKYLQNYLNLELAVLCFRAVKMFSPSVTICHRDFAVTGFAKGHQIAVVMSASTSQWQDVVDFLHSRQSAFFLAFLTERVLIDVSHTDFSPCLTISFPCRRVKVNCPFRGKRGCPGALGHISRNVCSLVFGVPRRTDLLSAVDIWGGSKPALVFVALSPPPSIFPL